MHEKLFPCCDHFPMLHRSDFNSFIILSKLSNENGKGKLVCNKTTHWTLILIVFFFVRLKADNCTQKQPKRIFCFVIFLIEQTPRHTILGG